MSPAVALFVLFGGQNLDGWQVLSGQWAVRDGALVCTAAPAAIRSTFESDRYVLSFEHHQDKAGQWRYRTHAALDGSGGTVGRDGPQSLDGFKVEKFESSGNSNVRTGVTLKSLEVARGQTAWPPAKTDTNERGFIVFESDMAGFEIRDVRVNEPGFVRLFDGKTLKGWEPVGRFDPAAPNWVAEAGVLRCTHHGGSWLRTLETYDDFVVRLEYQLPPGGNSGIYLRAPLEGRISQKGLEIQLLDDKGWKGKLKPSQRNGSVYSGIAPEVEVPAPPEQWNAIEVLCQGKRIRTTLNGVQLYDASLDDRKKDERLLHNPLATRPLEGFIGLQDHTGGPKFRNIRIRSLTHNPATQPGH